MSRQSPQAADLDQTQLSQMLRRFKVTGGEPFKFKDHPTADPAAADLDKTKADALLLRGIDRLSELQERLYANATWSVLLIIQAMDAAGKDSAIKHVLSGLNPQGVSVTAFKVPGPEDLAHDFLWRAHRVTPARGMIGVFNRSYYEEVLVARVHPEILARQGLPVACQDGKNFWDHRIDDIRAFESYMTRQGTRIIKVLLNVGRDEQRKRFLARLDTPDKYWKFSSGDLADRARWSAYGEAYQDAVTGTATDVAPWFVVPADSKRFARLMVMTAMVEALEDLKLEPPSVSADAQAAMTEARRVLMAEKH